MSKSKILFMMSGSIAAFKACQVISKLAQDGHEVQVAATPSAFKFVGAATLEGLTGRPVLGDIWENGRAMDHIHLTRWADFAILCPASANTIARLAHGLAEDLVSAMALAWPARKPFWIFPAMNRQMLAAAVTQENLSRLRNNGFSVAPTQSGSLACGEEGPGRMLEPDEILRLVTGPPRGRLLITAGATREPIDGIRFISNVSTGQTAAALADGLAAHGWSVTYLHGEGARQPVRANQRVGFGAFLDLDGKLRAALGSESFDAVIHCAAVSDFSVTGAEPERKIDSGSELSLRLKPNHKILPRLREYSGNKNIRVVGFKLTLNKSESETEAAARKLLEGDIDAVVANEWSRVERDRTRHPGSLITRGGKRDFANLDELSDRLNDLIGGAL
jgi:phosphopantothenoylcysteine decarboxylase/phosphopantothenate--cysteine ligase